VVFVAADAHVGGGVDEYLVQLRQAWAEAPRQVLELGFRLATATSQVTTVTTVTQSMVKASAASSVGQKCSARDAMITEPKSATTVPPMNPCLVDIASGYAFEARGGDRRVDLEAARADASPDGYPRCGTSECRSSRGAADQNGRCADEHSQTGGTPGGHDHLVRTVQVDVDTPPGPDAELRSHQPTGGARLLDDHCRSGRQRVGVRAGATSFSTCCASTAVAKVSTC
jgi:hypothetical protein